MTQKRVALYARVSTEQQTERDSIPAQIDALKKYADLHQYDIVGIYIDDGISGTLLNERDELQRLLNDVKLSKIDMILICKLDRWFRSVKHYMNTQEILDAYNVTWKTIWENYETETPAGRLMITQMLAFAEFEAGNTALRINRVFDYKKTKHEVLSGKIPFGYKIVDKHMVLDEEKANIVKNVFNTYVETGNLYDTMRRTEGLGLPKTQRGLKGLLQNEKYVGSAYGYDDYCEPIIDRQTFETTQKMLKRNIKKNQVHFYIFSGIVWCPECGRRMTGTSDRYKNTTYKVYRCSHRYRAIQTCTNTKTLNEEKLEKYLVRNLKEISFSALHGEGQVKTDDYKRQIENLEKKITRLKELYVNELIDIGEYRDDVSDYRARIDELNKKIRSCECDDKTALKKLVGMNLDEWYWTLTEEERRTLWRGVIDRIWYGIDKKIVVEFL